MKEWISDDHGTITGQRLMKQDNLADQKEICIHDGDEVIADDTQTGTKDPVLEQTYVNGSGIDSKVAVFEGGYDPTTAGGVNYPTTCAITSTPPPPWSVRAAPLRTITPQTRGDRP